MAVDEPVPIPTRDRRSYGVEFILAALIVMGTMLTLGGVASASTLPVTAYQQTESQWCWAASTKTVLNYHGAALGVSQCTLVKAAKGGSCPNEPGSFYGDLDEIYSAYGRAWGTKVAWFTNFATIQSRIDAGRPLQIRYGYKPLLTSGHILTIHGYSGTDTVWRADPADGIKKSSSWGYLSDNSTWRTTNTRYNQGI